MTLTIVGLSRPAWRILKQTRRCAGLAIFTLIFAVHFSVWAEKSASVAEDSLIYQGYDVYPNSMYWWKNNFYFADVGSGEKKIYRYIPQTGDLNEVEDYPHKKLLSADQQDLYRAYAKDVFVSPDGKLFFYTSQFDTYSYAEGEGPVQLYAVGEFPSEHYDKGTYLPLRIEEFYHPDLIRWSENSDSFTIEQIGMQANIWYVRIKRVQGYLVGVDETYIGSMDILGYVFGISSDGNRLLFPNYSGDLLLWDARTPVDADQLATMESAQQIPVNGVASAVFIPGDDQHILILNEQGIVRYDLKTQATELLSDQVNSTWAGKGLFSPDDHYLAFLTKNNDNDPNYPQVHLISLVNIENSLSGVTS